MKHGRLKNRIFCVVVFLVSSSPLYGGSEEGFQCQAILGNVTNVPMDIQIFVKNNTNRTVELAGGHYKIVFESYGDGLRTTITINTDPRRPLMISTFEGNSGSTYTHDGFNDISVSCIRYK